MPKIRFTSEQLSHIFPEISTIGTLPRKKKKALKKRIVRAVEEYIVKMIRRES
jgi:hypothetical protein